METVAHEPLLRLACFAAVLLTMVLWEAFAPRRTLHSSKPVRWWSNLALVVIDGLVARWLVPLGAVGVALVAEDRGWGLLHFLEVPLWLAVLVSIVALDFVIWLQHVMFHAVPILWRLHRVHHADLDVDATTGVRFHPIEILLSLGIKISAVLLLGAPALAVLIFEIVLNATSIFNHANIKLPSALDRVLRLFIVTPDMHRVHHSTEAIETNSNFGFNLPWWDFLFGTYCAAPQAGHEKMQLGLVEYRDERVSWLHWMLLLPFIGSVGSYPINQAKTANERQRTSTSGLTNSAP
jgi:sterol desaturase/sphingolipid hydroxylase (fatty acid hydroxylase superfamily)